MSGRANVEVAAELVPRHFTLNIAGTLDGFAVMELVQVLSEWSDDAAGGLVGAIRNAVVEANGGKQLELPQPIVVPDSPPGEDEDGGAGVPAASK